MYVKRGNMVEYKKLGNIFCKYFRPKRKVKKVIVAVHGFTGDKESSGIKAIADAVEKNTLVVSFDLPCHGEEKDGLLSLETCFEYVNSVIGGVIKEYPDKPISIFAISFGAFLTLNYLKTSTHQFDHIILRSPAIFMDETLVNNILPMHHILLETLQEHKVNLSHEKGIYVDANFVSDLRNSSLVGSRFDRHIDIIQGDADDIVDYKKNEEYYKTKFKSYTLCYIKGADHSIKKAGDLERVKEIVKRIMDKK